MPSPYTQQQWLNGVISPPYGPLSDERLSHIEQGISGAWADASTALEQAAVSAAQAFALTDSVVATATEFDVDGGSEALPSGSSGLLVLDPWVAGGADCEVVPFTDTDGDTLLLATPLVLPHLASARVLFRDTGTVHAEWFGADPTMTRDSSPAWQRMLDRGGSGRTQLWAPGDYDFRTPVFDDNPSKSVWHEIRLVSARFHATDLTNLPTSAEFDAYVGGLGRATGAKFIYFTNILRPGGWVAGTPVSGGIVTATVAASGGGPMARPRNVVRNLDITSPAASPGVGFSFGTQDSMDFHGRFRIDGGVRTLRSWTRYSDAGGRLVGSGSATAPIADARPIYQTSSGDNVLILGVTGSGSGSHFDSSNGLVVLCGIGSANSLKSTRSAIIASDHTECDNAGAQGPATLLDAAKVLVLSGHTNPPDATGSIPASHYVNTIDLAGFDVQGDAFFLDPFAKTNYKGSDAVDAGCFPVFRIGAMHTNQKLMVGWWKSVVSIGGSEDGNGLYFTSDDALIQAAIDAFPSLVANPFVVRYRAGFWELRPLFHPTLIVCSPKTPPTVSAVTTNQATNGGVLTTGRYYGYKLAAYDELKNLSDSSAATGVRADGFVSAAVKVAGGTGYIVGDVLTVSGGTSSTTAQVTVATVGGGGAVLTVTVSRGGSYTVKPGNTVSVTGGSGSGATFDLTWIGGCVRLSLNVKQNAAIVMWRGESDTDQATANANALSAPTKFIVLPMLAGNARFLDTGTRVNKIPWQTYAGGTSPAPPTSDSTQNAVRLDNGKLVLTSTGALDLTGHDLLNARRVDRVEALADATTITPNAGAYDKGIVAELSADFTLANPTLGAGAVTAVDGQRYELRIKTTTARAYAAYGTEYKGSATMALPAVTSGGGKYDRLTFERNAAASTWDLIGLVLGR